VNVFDLDDNSSQPDVGARLVRLTGAPQGRLTLLNRHVYAVVAGHESRSLYNDEQLRVHGWMAPNNPTGPEPNDGDGARALDTGEGVDCCVAALEALDWRRDLATKLQNVHDSSLSADVLYVPLCARL
jgi:hypothetical protein